MDYKLKNFYKTTLNFPLQLSPSWTYICEGSSEKEQGKYGINQQCSIGRSTEEQDRRRAVLWEVHMVMDGMHDSKNFGMF